MHIDQAHLGYISIQVIRECVPAVARPDGPYNTYPCLTGGSVPIRPCNSPYGQYARLYWPSPSYRGGHRGINEDNFSQSGDDYKLFTRKEAQ